MTWPASQAWKLKACWQNPATAILTEMSWMLPWNLTKRMLRMAAMATAKPKKTLSAYISGVSV
jgi:hypothetical protein